MLLLSCDIETTGLSPDEDQILQIAAVIDGTQFINDTVDKLPFFNKIVHYDRISGSPFALAMNAGIIKRIVNANEEIISPPEIVATLFEEFITKYSDNSKITAAGKNFASFDRQFLLHFAPKAVKILHHRCIDPGTLYATPEDICPPSTEQCITRFNFENPKYQISTTLTHDALDDARTVIRLIRNRWGNKIF